MSQESFDPKSLKGLAKIHHHSRKLKMFLVILVVGLVFSVFAYVKAETAENESKVYLAMMQ